MENENSIKFWRERKLVKFAVSSSAYNMRPFLESEALSFEEKIFLRQAIDWLEYLEKRHPVNDEKFEKKYGPPVSEKDD